MRIRPASAAWIAAGVIAAAGAVLLAREQALAPPEPLAVGTAAPVIDLPGATGARVRAGGSAGVLAFVSTTCGSCERSAAELVRLAANGVVVAAIAQREASSEAVAAFAAGPLGGAVPIARDDGPTGAAYRITAYPTVYVIGPNGRIADAWVGDQPAARFDAALSPPG